MNFSDIPFIDQKPSIDVKKIWFFLPQDEVIGDLGRFYRTIVLRNDYFNKLIAEIYTMHYLWRKSLSEEEYSFQYSMPDEIGELNFKIETLTYWLRKSCDELICLQYILTHWCQKDEILHQVRIDSIGKLLSKEINDDIKMILYNKHLKHEPFLNDINNVSNTFKHSFVNYNVLDLMGKSEPTLNALRFKMNKIEASGPEFFSFYLKGIINRYNHFYTDSLMNLEETRNNLYKQFKKE
jgi:hypothetical protein